MPTLVCKTFHYTSIQRGIWRHLLFRSPIKSYKNDKNLMAIKANENCVKNTASQIL